MKNKHVLWRLGIGLYMLLTVIDLMLHTPSVLELSITLLGITLILIGFFTRKN